MALSCYVFFLLYQYEVTQASTGWLYLYNLVWMNVYTKYKQLLHVSLYCNGYYLV